MCWLSSATASTTHYTPALCIAGGEVGLLDGHAQLRQRDGGGTEGHERVVGALGVELDAQVVGIWGAVVRAGLRLPGHQHHVLLGGGAGVVWGRGGKG